MITLYAIPNCNTVKKARAWLDENHIEYDFHNYKKQGIDEATLKQWIDDLGWEVVINRKGMTWRKLDASIRDSMNAENALNIMLENQSIIKRPLIIKEGKKILGFNETDYQEFFL